MSDDRQRFEAFLAKFRDCYQSVEVRVVCGKKDNEWRNIFTRLELRPESQGELAPAAPPPTTDVVKGILDVLPASETRRLMADIEKGVLELKGERVVYPPPHDSRRDKGIGLGSYYFGKRSSIYPESEMPREWSYARLGGSGIQASDCLGSDDGEVENQLQALDTPYQDLGDLVSGFAKRRSGSDRVPRNSTVLVCAPLMVRFGECRCDEGALRFTLEGAAAFAKTAVRVALIERRIDGTTARNPHDVREGEWQVVFSRDCLEVHVKKQNRVLPIFVCHFKSMMEGRPETRHIREAEAMAVKHIINERFSNPSKENWLVVGDLNDYTEVDGNADGGHGLGPLLDNGFSVDLGKRIVDPKDRWTHFYASERTFRQLDYILASPKLAQANANVVPAIVRDGQPYRADRYQGPRWPRVGYDRPKASDHCPVVVELKI